MLALFFRKVCQLKALMSIEFNGIISVFKICTAYTYLSFEKCRTGNPRLPHFRESLRGLLWYIQGFFTTRSSRKDTTSVKLNKYTPKLVKTAENLSPKSNFRWIPCKPSRHKIIHVLFFLKVCQLIALMNDEFNGIINGFEIFALHIRIFRVKKVVPTDGPTQAVKETCTGEPRLPYLIESLWGLI